MECLVYLQDSQQDKFELLLKCGSQTCVAVSGKQARMDSTQTADPDVSASLAETMTTLRLDSQQDQKLNTVDALFYCAATGQLPLLRLLLKADFVVKTDQHGRTLLMQACLSGQPHMVQYLVIHHQTLGLDLHHKDNRGRNALFYCVEGGQLVILQFLLGCGLKPESDISGLSILMLAVKNVNFEIVSHLLECGNKVGLDINSEDTCGQNALFYSMICHNVHLTKQLLDSGVHIVPSRVGPNVLSQAITDRNFRFIVTLLQSNQDLTSVVNSKDAKGSTVLCQCIWTGNFALLEKLSQYYDFRSDGDQDGVTLLMKACQMAPVSVIKHLVERVRVNVEKADSRGKTAIFHAIESSNVEALSYLLDHIEQLSDNNFGHSALIAAVITGNFLLVELLLKSRWGRNLISRSDKDERNVLHYCAIHNRYGMVPVLEACGAAINAQTKDGLTPLMYSCAHGNVLTVSALLKRRAYLDPVDQSHNSALHFIFQNRYPSFRCLKLLAIYGIDFNVKNSLGKTPLMLACEHCAKDQISIISYMLNKGADPYIQDNDGNDSLNYCPFDAEYVKAMIRTTGEILPHELQAVEIYMPEIQEKVDVNDMLAGLVKNSIITKTLQFDVMKRPPTERIDKLFEILKFRGKRAFGGLCQVLKELDQAVLAYELLKTSYIKESEYMV